jgi:hypothetical protein
MYEHSYKIWQRGSAEGPAILLLIPPLILFTLLMRVLLNAKTMKLIRMYVFRCAAQDEHIYVRTDIKKL